MTIVFLVLFVVSFGGWVKNKLVANVTVRILDEHGWTPTEDEVKATLVQLAKEWFKLS